MNQPVHLLTALALALLAACSSGHACPTANACTERNATQCVGDQVETCLPDSNCCLLWSAPSDCDAGSCSAGACAGPNACAGKECGYPDSCGVACPSGSTCTFIGCDGNLGMCNQNCAEGCVNGSTSECLMPCQQNCAMIHTTCCNNYGAEFPNDKCQ